MNSALSEERKEIRLDVAGQTRTAAVHRCIGAFAADPCLPGRLHLALQVDDIDAAVALCQRHGWQAQGRPQPIPAGPFAGTPVMYAVAADGTTIALMQPPI